MGILKKYIAHVVDLNVWHQNSDTIIRTVNVDTVKSCQEELSLRLVYGEHSTLEEHKATLCTNHDLFTLTDQELEVDLIEHKI